MTEHDYIDPTDSSAIWRVCTVCEHEFYTDDPTKGSVCKSCKEKEKA